MTRGARISVPLKPWTTPNFAHLDLPSGAECSSLSIKALGAEALDELVNEWRKEVYEKAGVPLPEKRVKP